MEDGVEDELIDTLHGSTGIDTEALPILMVFVLAVVLIVVVFVGVGVFLTFRPTRGRETRKEKQPRQRAE